MSERPTLDGLPVELVNEIDQLLAFRDICSLRQTCREVAAKTTNSQFKKRFLSKKVRLLDNGDLHRFIRATQPGNLGCLLQNLTLVGIIPTPRNRLAGVQHHPERGVAGLLQAAFANLRSNSPHLCLESLSLEVDEIEPPPRLSLKMQQAPQPALIWDTSERVFLATTLALQATGLPIHALDIFGRTKRCSLEIEKLRLLLDNSNIAHSFKPLKKLTLSLSNRVVYEIAEFGNLAGGSTRTRDLGRILQLCPNLEDFSVHWFNRRSPHHSLQERRFFDHLSPLESLKRCALRGLTTSETALLTFLKSTRLSHLIIEEHHLEGHSSEYRPIFDELVHHTQLEFLYLKDLHERSCGRSFSPHNCITFDGEPGNFPIPMSAHNGSNKLIREGLGDCGKPVAYRQVEGYMLGSQAAMIMNWEKELQYGSS